MPGGNVALDSVRVMIVTVNPARCSAAVMGVPKLPEAGREVSRGITHHIERWIVGLTPQIATFWKTAMIHNVFFLVISDSTYCWIILMLEIET